MLPVIVMIAVGAITRYGAFNKVTKSSRLLYISPSKHIVPTKPINYSLTVPYQHHTAFIVLHSIHGIGK